MDSETKPRSKVKAKKIGRKNEKKKKVDKISTEETLDEVCRQMSNLLEEDNTDGGSGSSTDSEDLVNAINYNTITSLAALKDIIQGDSNDTPETDSFFQHYFMNHCNNLSSRNSSSNSPFPFAERRRLSQCREEDEDDERKEGDHPPSAESSESDSEITSQGSFNTLSKDDDSKVVTEVEQPVDDCVDAESQSPSKRMVMGARHKFLVTTAEAPPQTTVERVSSHITMLTRTHHNAHTVHFGTRGAEEQRPNVRNIFPGQNLHLDKNYFDSSLIEIRSTVDDGLSNLEDIWVKRADDKQVNILKI